MLQDVFDSGTEVDELFTPIVYTAEAGFVNQCLHRKPANVIQLCNVPLKK